jgi:hypothetical protein
MKIIILAIHFRYIQKINKKINQLLLFLSKNNINTLQREITIEF